MANQYIIISSSASSSNGISYGERQPLLIKKPNKQDNEAHSVHHGHSPSQIYQFYIFLCMTTAFKSFEAGIISSMMSDIQSDFSLGYDAEGTVTASPDYGIAPGALLAIFVFRWCSAYQILAAVLWGTALVSLFCALHPTLPTLLVARAVGGLLWSHAATHFPVWIDQHGPKKYKTLWLACTNVALLLGVLSGYLVGGIIRANELPVTWVQLYFLEGILMAICGVVFHIGFDADLLRIDRGNHTIEQSTTTEISDKEPQPTTIIKQGEDLKQVLQTLVGSTPFVLAVAITGCISGGIVFSLYFVTQVSEARGMETRMTLFLVMFVFVTAPAPGILVGSWIVNTLGGYTDHVVTFSVALASAIFVLLAALAMPWSWMVWGETWHIPYVAAFWVFSFVGAMAGPPLNGVAVSAVPQASHVASALQFALANAAKIVVPQVGGYICTLVGLIDGFNVTLVASAALFVLFSAAGTMHARKQQQSLSLLLQQPQNIVV